MPKWVSSPTPTKLIVYLAFVRDDEGELQPAFEAREAQSEKQAKHQARLLWTSGKYAGALAWRRSADLVNGEFGGPVVLFSKGEMPEMEHRRRRKVDIARLRRD